VTAGILLAAGLSRRMGRAKLLLPLDGRPVVRHAAEGLLAAGVEPLSAVVGPDGEAVTAALAGLNSCVAGKSVRFWRRIGVAGTLHGQARPVDAKADAALDTDRVAALSTRRLAVTAKSLLP
jgi:molybdenum cofactor cytidylyltransferase